MWLEFALACGYIDRRSFDELDATYEGIIGSLVHMITHPESWVITTR